MQTALVSETVLASSQLTEVPSGLGNNVAQRLKNDAAERSTIGSDIELSIPSSSQQCRFALERTYKHVCHLWEI